MEGREKKKLANGSNLLEVQGCAAAIVLAVPPFELVALPKPENQEGENEFKKPSLVGVLLGQKSKYAA